MKNRKTKGESDSKLSSDSSTTSASWQFNCRLCQSWQNISSGITMILLVTNVQRYPKLLYVKTCDDCQRRGGLRKNNILHLILAKALFQWIGIDIVRLLTIIRWGNYYIVTAIDYFTKWPIAKVLKKATARTVSKFIYEKIICEHECPEILQSDQGCIL